MELALHEEQKLLQQSFRSFYSEHASTEIVRAARESSGFDADLWKRLVELGGHDLALPESMGGGGGTLLDAALVAIEAGRAIAPIPYAETVVALRAAARGGGIRESTGEPWAIALDTSMQVVDNAVLGETGWTTSGACAGLVLVGTEDGSLAVVRGGEAPGSRVDTFGGLPAAILRYEHAPVVTRWVCDIDQLEFARAELRLLLAAQLVGCGRRALELGLEYVNERRQFGSLIGSFQAIQHRLADCLIGLDAAELLVVRAAAYEGDASQLPWRSAVAASWAADVADNVTAEVLQFFGGYGFTVECDAQLYLGYAKPLGVTLRDRGRLRDDVVATPPTPQVTDGAVGPAGGFRRGPAEEQFRQEVMDFLDAHLTADARNRIARDGEGYDPEFHRAMAEQRWILAALDPEDGGIGLDPGRVSVLWETLYYGDAPIGAQQLTEIVASVVAQVGTDYHRELVLEPALAGAVRCAIGYTEPDIGSDVAAIRTSAQRLDTGYLVNGGKIFTTMAQVADFVFLLVRTNPSAPKHKGLTTLLVPLDQEGIEIVPIPTLAGEQTNAVFFRDVFVPEALRVGDENEGWAILNRGLAVERATLGGFVGRLRRLYDDLVAALEEQGRLDDATARVVLAEALTATEAAAVLSDRVYCHTPNGKMLDVEAAMAKIVATETLKRLAQRALDVVGPTALAAPGQPQAVRGGRLEELFRHAQVATIYAGTSEVLRNLIAQRGLRLPRPSA